MPKIKKITVKPIELENIKVLTPELHELDMAFKCKHDLANNRDIQKHFARAYDYETFYNRKRIV